MRYYAQWIVPLVLFGFGLGFNHSAIAALQFDIEYLDSPTSGFNAQEPRQPIGGNTGTTLGEQRRQVLNTSLARFGNVLHSDITIHIKASFANYGGSTNSAVLASAGPEWFNFDFRNAPAAKVAFPSALASKISGQDLSDRSRNIADIALYANADIDGNALGSSYFYYGLDGNSPEKDVDFLSVISHELMHGLGFFSAIDLETGHNFGCDQASCRRDDIQDIFSTYLAKDNGAVLTALGDMSRSDRLAAASADGEIVWDGANGKTLSQELSSGTRAGRPLIYAPTKVSSGSTLSHLDFRLSPNDLMEASYAGSLDLTSTSLAMLGDLGWGATADIGFDIRQDQQPTKIGPDQRQTNQYSLVLNNSGKHIARDVIAQITLTNGRLTSLTNNQSNSGCIALTSQIMKCKLDQLASQAFYDLGFEATAVESATLSFNISVTGNYVDLKPDNNQGLIQMMPRYIEGGSLTNSNTFPTPGAPSPSSQAPSGASEIIVTPQQGGFAWSLVILGLGLLGSARRTNIN